MKLESFAGKLDDHAMQFFYNGRLDLDYGYEPGGKYTLPDGYVEFVKSIAWVHIRVLKLWVTFTLTWDYL